MWSAIAAGRLRFISSYGGRDDLYAIVKTEPQARSEASLPARITPRDFLNAAKDFSPDLPNEYRHAAYFFYRLYKASYGRMPRREELIADAQEIERGVVENDQEWRQKLENNKRRFAEEWCARAPFESANGKATNAEFVNAVFARAGIELSEVERREIVGNLESGTQRRADVLLKAVNDDGFYLREYNAAYVLFMYFIYLERNPDDPPDGNMNGLNFWVDYLNRNGDHRELSRIFFTSSERKERFGAQ